MEKLRQCHRRRLGMFIRYRALKSLNNIAIMHRGWWVLHLMTNPPQQSSPTTVPPMPVIKRTLLHSTTSSPSLARLIGNVLIIGGDMSTQRGKDENNEFWLHNLSNRNRENQTDFSFESKLACLITKFKKLGRNLWT